MSSRLPRVEAAGCWLALEREELNRRESGRI